MSLMEGRKEVESNIGEGKEEIGSGEDASSPGLGRGEVGSILWREEGKKI